MFQESPGRPHVQHILRRNTSQQHPSWNSSYTDNALTIATTKTAKSDRFRSSTPAMTPFSLAVVMVPVSVQCQYSRERASVSHSVASTLMSSRFRDRNLYGRKYDCNARNPVSNSSTRYACASLPVVQRAQGSMTLGIRSTSLTAPAVGHQSFESILLSLCAYCVSAWSNKVYSYFCPLWQSKVAMALAAV